jgi:selenocysteine-specific elongation factor
MRTSCFDAAVDFSPPKKGKVLDAQILFKKTKVSASFSFYPQSHRPKSGEHFVRIHTSRPLSLKWEDRFEVEEGKSLKGKGTVLNPQSEKVKGKKAIRRIAFLQKLLGGEEEMLAAAVEERGSEGIREEELLQFSSLSRARLLSLSQELEERGVLRILAFSPLFLLSKKSFDFLCQKILRYLSAFHDRKPQEQGVPWERLRKRFGVDRKILSLAIHHLSREDKVDYSPDRVVLSDFEQTLSVRDEQLLKNFEEMCLRGEIQTGSLQELGKSLGISFQKMDLLISRLVERKRVVLGKDGFIIHSQWLDELVSRIRKSGKRELSVSDFKKMTGLSRKYIIPLLELLDQLGITRRRGATREIL